MNSERILRTFCSPSHVASSICLFNSFHYSYCVSYKSKVDLSERHIDLSFDNGPSSNACLKFDKFKLIQKSFSSSKKNMPTADGFYESIFRFQIQPELEQTPTPVDSKQSKLRTTELVQLTCSMCKANLLKSVDSLPDKK